MADTIDPFEKPSPIRVGADPLQAGPVHLPPEAPDAPEPVSGPSGWIVALLIVLALLVLLAWLV